MRGSLRFLALCVAAYGGVAFASANDPLTLPARVVQSGPDAVVIEYDLEDVTRADVVKFGDSYEAHTIAGEGTTYEYGRPVLPAVSRMVVIPPTGAVQLEVDAGEARSYRAANPPALMDDSLFAYDAPALASLYPAAIAEITEPFVIRGVRLVKVTVFPIQYDPVNQTYIKRNNIRATVRFTDGESINPVRNPDRKYRSPEFLKIMNLLAINGDQVGRDDPDDVDRPYVGHYLVVAHNATLSWNESIVREWIEFRRRTGYKMDIYSVSNNDGGNPQNVKNRIQERYDDYIDAGIEPFDHIIIVGDEQYDRPADYQAQNMITPFAGQSIWGGGYPHADFLFATLEGGQNDQHPDVSYSRMPAGSEGAAKLIFGRTLAYEESPRMRDPEWFTRGASYSQHWGNSESSAWHISIHTNVRWGEEVLQSLGFDDITFYEDYSWDQQAQRIGPVIRDVYNEGANVLVGRAELYYWISQFQGVNANTVFPLDIVYSGHGEWALQTVFRSGSYPNNMKGPVARTCCWGWPATAPLSWIWMTMVNGVLQRDIPLGWTRMYSVNAIENVFPNINIPNVNGSLYPHIKTDTDMFGDPGLQPWIGVPRLVEVTAPDSIRANSKLVEVFVHAPNSDEPVPGARVTFYAPGNMPANNQNDAYANYTDFLMRTVLSDSNGIARFILEDGEALVNNTILYATASGRDIRPFKSQIRIRNSTRMIELADWSLTEQSGNGDDAINPGEIYSLSIVARNTDPDDAMDGVGATVESLSPYLIVGEGSQLDFGAIEAGGEAQGDHNVELTFTSELPDGRSRPATRPVLRVTFTSDDRVWTTGINFEPVAPNLEIRSIVGGAVVPDSVYDLMLDISNIGTISSPDMQVELRSLGMGITVADGQSSLREVAPGQHARLARAFSISGNRIVVPGSKNTMALLFRAQDGFVDSAYFELQISNERRNAPTGPDGYGYICFDDTDTLWDMAPEYEWIEIDPRAQNPDFEGTRLDSIGQSPFDVGKCQVIPLDFETRFYGLLYDRITIATNGFIAMGDQRRITNYQNWPMDQAIGGGVGMLAPFWDDLRYPDQNSGIYYYHDEENGRFIVQWSHAKLAAGGQNPPDLSFQVILLDNSVWITESGDQNIVFQYKSVRTDLANLRNGDTEWVDATPHASVGISSPDGTTGINYFFDEDQPVSAAPIANRRVLLFSTSPKYKACTLSGYVTDARTGNPVEGAIVFTEHGFVAYTDESGYWRIQDALAEVPFDITGRKQGYNDSTYVDNYIAEGDSAEFNFDLLHPEFTPSAERITTMFDPGFQRQLGFSLFNGGNGPLTWRAEKRLLADANAAPWELRRHLEIGDSVDDDRIEGVVFANEHFYFSGANGADPSLIYVMDRSFTLVDTFQQAGESRYGMKDLEWDGQLLWGSGDTAIYGFTTAGELVTQWRTPLNPCNNIAYDRSRDLYWISGTTTHIFGCDVNGQVIDTLNRKGMRMYGLAYWPEDPDGMNLYILHVPGQDLPPVVYKMNTDSGDTVLAYTMRPAENATGVGGLWITNEYDVYSWVMMTNQNIAPIYGGDRLDIYQLEARKDWFNLDDLDGVLGPEETQEFIITFDSEGLPDTTFEGEFRFTHNADDGLASIGVSLRVIGAMPPDPFDLAYPANGDTVTAAPLYGDTLRMPAMQFGWNRSFDPNIPDSLITYRFYISSQNQTFMWQQPDTSILLNIDTLGLPLWFDAPVNWTVAAISGGDSVACRAPYSFSIAMNDVDADRLKPPFEFGLQSIYPSPFNSKTSIRFGVDRSLRTTLKVYDLLGREAAMLFDRVPEPGNYAVSWDAADLASGVYMVRLESAGRKEIRKIALIR